MSLILHCGNGHVFSTAFPASFAGAKCLECASTLARVMPEDESPFCATSDGAALGLRVGMQLEDEGRAVVVSSIRDGQVFLAPVGSHP